jgi:hypothetical protein
MESPSLFKWSPERFKHLLSMFIIYVFVCVGVIPHRGQAISFSARPVWMHTQSNITNIIHVSVIQTVLLLHTSTRIIRPVWTPEQASCSKYVVSILFLTNINSKLRSKEDWWTTISFIFLCLYQCPYISMIDNHPLIPEIKIMQTPQIKANCIVM